MSTKTLNSPLHVTSTVKNQTKCDQTFKIKKRRPLNCSWLKYSLNAFPGGGNPVVTSSIYSLDLMSKCTLCPNPPGSPYTVGYTQCSV